MFIPWKLMGLLVGTNEPPCVYAALPVGQTTQWGDPSDRFRLLPSAFEVAMKLTISLQMEMLGLYHSHSE